MFTRSGGGVWTQQGNKLVGTGAAGAGQQRGNSVALSADGNTAIVGGDADNSNVGAVWVFGQPSIAGVTPDGGSVGGEDDVTISGVNLFNVTSVTFGGVAAINVTPVDAETVMATTPPHAAGRVDVILSTQTSGGSRLRGGYTYEPHATVTTLISSRNPSTVGQRVRFTASVSGGGNAASGKVTFKNGTQTLATRRLKNGVASIVTSELAAGTHTISVSFLRNRMFAGSRARLRQRVRN
jgi:hypothetical protein